MINDIVQDGIKELVNIAAANASTALSEMTGLLITVSVPELRIVNIYDFYAEFSETMEEIVYGSVVKFQGGLEGYLLIFMDKKSMEEVVGRLLELLGGESSEELALDTIKEVFNIFSSSYVTAIYNFLNIYATHTPPTVTEDFLGSILNTALGLMSFNTGSDVILTVKVDLRIQKDDKVLGTDFWMVHLMTSRDIEVISQAIMSL
ncbi:MAG: chemotaxis protein CheC [Euryarchaeota archaeon]|nr:chemotaxis protein CheC [Euryarchaeota archaeon]MCD6158195.1 chemotaxis protein CheC [Euryarchaeota archaeon]